MSTDGMPSSVGREELAAKQAQEDQGYWHIVWRQLRKNRPGMAGLAIIAVIVVTAVLAPLLANDRPIVAKYKGETVFPAFTSYVDIWVPWQSLRDDMKGWELSERYFPLSDHYASLGEATWKEVVEESEAAGGEHTDLDWYVMPPVRFNPQKFDKTSIKQRPDREHRLGADDQGRDVLARIIYGCVVAILVGVVAMGVATTIGVTLGVTAGYYGGRVDMVLSRITEVVMTFPTFFLIIAVISFLEASIINIMLVIGLVRWTGIFRLVRGEVLKAKSQDYVVAARALGISNRKIMFRHILPNSVAPVFVSVAFGIAAAVLLESSLSFLGFGDTSVPSWGEIISQGRRYIGAGLTYLVFWPGIAVFVTLTGFNLFGQGLRDAMDPKLRR